MQLRPIYISTIKMAKSDKKEKKSKEVTEKVTESIEVGADVDMEDVTVAKVRGYTIYNIEEQIFMH